MKDEFISVLREPDFVTGATERSPFRFEEDKNYPCPIDFSYSVTDGRARVTVHPSKSPVKFLKLRFFGDNSFVEKVYGDQWGCSSHLGEIEWRTVKSDRVLPWFCYLYSSGRLACYGVKTGADAFAFWQVDRHGVTLFINLCNGNDGTDLKDSIVACEIVELIDNNCKSVYNTAKRFAALMCPSPILPRTPIFGMNDWYWAYGDNSRESILRQTDYLRELTRDCTNSPCMVIDDGWQMRRSTVPGSYNGGPWEGNVRYGNMATLANEIRKRGARPGIWFRSLLTLDPLPEGAILETKETGFVMDPSHPAALEKVKEITSHIRGLGYEIIKHDFSSTDAMGKTPNSLSTPYLLTTERSYFDKTKTTATILKEFYRTIQNASCGAEIIGCDTIPHLTAGIHSLMRVGSDTSGRSYEWTKRQGVNSVMRLPMNNTFFRADFDCAAFTERVAEDINLDYLEMCAYTGTSAVASAKPGVVSRKGDERLAEIYKIADSGKYELGVRDYELCAEPEVFEDASGNIIKAYDWTRPYNGSRVVYGWLE